MEQIFFLKNGRKPLYIQLYDAIIDKIYAGSIDADEKMPSIRQLAKSMNLSRTTIETAYNQLVSEGFLYSIPQKGYFVMDISKPLQKEKSHHKKYSNDNNVSRTKPVLTLDKEKQIRYDFVSEYVEEQNFNITMWKRNINKVLNQQDTQLFSYSNPFGENLLKEAITGYFTRVRGINAKKEQVVIGAGSSALLRALSILLKEEKYNELCIDDPGFNQAKEVFAQNGYSIRGIPLINNVIDISMIEKLKNRVLFTSPSYQFPYGEIMQVQTRHDVLNWAKETDSYIIEDDYNNELRYVGKPVPSLQGMDYNDRVIYLGAFSTLLIPSIRVSFIVLPLHLVDKYHNMFLNRVQSASKLEQLALASLINSGDFGKHIRKLRKSYRNKYYRIKELCAKYLTDVGKVHIPSAGLICVIELIKPVSEVALKQVSYELNVNILGISWFMTTNTLKGLEKKLILNYRGIKEQDLENGIILIKELICQLY